MRGRTNFGQGARKQPHESYVPRRNLASPCQRVSTPSCACTRVSTRTLAVAQYVGGCSSVDESRGNVFSELWIQVRLKCGRFKYAGSTVSSDVIKAEESWGRKSC